LVPRFFGRMNVVRLRAGAEQGCRRDEGQREPAARWRGEAGTRRWKHGSQSLP
jgi:hypothetical protein